MQYALAWHDPGWGSGVVDVVPAPVEPVRTVGQGSDREGAAAQTCKWLRGPWGSRGIQVGLPGVPAVPEEDAVRRSVRWGAVFAGLALVASACGGSSSPSKVASQGTAGSKAPIKVGMLNPENAAFYNAPDELAANKA